MFERYKLRKEKTLFELVQFRKAREVLESMPEFARDADEDKWKALSTGKKVYNAGEIQEMQEQASNLYYKNPLAGGIIETLVNFVVGKQMKIIALDENPEVQAYWDKFYRVNKFDKKSKELVRRTLRDGEMFLRFFEPKEGRDVQAIRFVEPNEIADVANAHSFGIETDPDDIETVVNYHRSYTANDKTQAAEEISAEEIIHEKIKVDSNVKRGVSFFTGIAPYITKYKGWLDDRITLNKIRTIFNLVAKPTSISPEAFKSQFPDVTGKTAAGGTARKQMPKSGSILISKGVEYEFKNLEINASDTKDDGRAILLMIVAGTNLAEYMVTGDASNANYSSTMVAESPAVKAFEAWQDTFEKVFQAIFRKVISYGIENGHLKENSKKTITTFDREKGKDITKEEDVPTNRDCQVDFPILIHRDIKEETEALTIQRQNNWVSDRTSASKLGYDYKEEQDQIAREVAQEQKGNQEKKAEIIKQQEE